MVFKSEIFRKSWPITSNCLYEIFGNPSCHCGKNVVVVVSSEFWISFRSASMTILHLVMAIPRWPLWYIIDSRYWKNPGHVLFYCQKSRKITASASLFFGQHHYSCIRWSRSLPWYDRVCHGITIFCQKLFSFMFYSLRRIFH